MASLIEIVEALADALEPIKTEIPDLQISAYYNIQPTPPSLDIYPATPFQEPSGFKNGYDAFFTIRARSTTTDHISGQKALLRMLDPASAESVQGAIEEDVTLSGTVQSATIEPETVTGYTEYIDDAQTGGRLLGCEWKVRVIA